MKKIELPLDFKGKKKNNWSNREFLDDLIQRNMCRVHECIA